MAKYRILSIDGGGIRGIVTAVLMQRLQATPGLERFLDKVDLVAGTSTGGLLALGIARGLGLDEIRDLYVNDGPDIFDDSWLDDLLDLGKLRGADYKIAPMRRVFKKVLGEETTLGQLRKRVLITAFDMDNEDEEELKRTWKPKLFHNFPGDGNDRSRLAYKVGMYTAAAPTYFPSVDGFIDGGVFANNPAMCALAQTQDKRYRPTPLLDRVELLSLGTGTSLFYIRGKTLDWGYAQWIKPLISLMLDGISGIADYQCQQMLRNRYHRLAPVFPPDVSIPMDEVKKIPYMIQFAESLDLRQTVRWMRRHWMAP
ncbi:MAG: patatin-like phospholipase family protein [Thermoanaerobaculales bacterium]|nr:patatin-like phospholipase family protein [Thermoanaerobaculales bacterium]